MLLLFVFLNYFCRYFTVKKNKAVNCCLTDKKIDKARFYIKKCNFYGEFQLTTKGLTFYIQHIFLLILFPVNILEQLFFSCSYFPID